MNFKTINDIFILSKDGENRSIKMDYETINNKIVIEIKENYLKTFHKAMKKFEIIMTGYNASQQKDLHVFEEYGCELVRGIKDDDWLYYFAIIRPTLKMNIGINLRKRLRDNILEYDPEFYFSKVYINILVDKTDEIFELIKQLEKVVPFSSIAPFAYKSIEYTVFYKEDGYVLSWSYPFH